MTLQDNMGPYGTIQDHTVNNGIKGDQTGPHGAPADGKGDAPLPLG